MLVLSRKLREQIQIGDNVTITVLRIKGNTVRIGIDAPQDIRVVRGELPPKREIRDVAVFRSHPERNEVIEMTTSEPRESSEPAAHGGKAPSRSGATQAASGEENGTRGGRMRGQAINQAAPETRGNRLHDLVQSITGLETPMS